MIITLKDNKAYFTFFTEIERSRLVNALTWEDVNSGVVSSVLFEDELGLYSYQGVYKYLFRYYHNFNISVEGLLEQDPLNIELDPNILDGISLKDFQLEAIKAAIDKKVGIVVCPTSSGKTEIMLATFKTLLDAGEIDKGIFIVPSVQLLNNFHERALSRGIKAEDIGLIYGKKKEFKDKKLYIAIVNSFFSSLKKNLKEALDLVSSLDFVAFDEGHHIKGMMSSDIFIRANKATYNLCFTGSPFSGSSVTKNFGDSLVYCITGGPIYEIGYDKVYESGLTAKPYYTFIPVAGRMHKNKAPYINIYNKYILNNEERNKIAINLINWLVSNDVSVLILVQRLAHAHILMSMLKTERAIAVFGGNTSITYYNGVIREQDIDYSLFKEDFKSGKYNIIIGSQVLDEGFELSEIVSVLMLGGGKSRIKQVQRIGRGLRKKQSGKNVVYLFDFNDHSHVFLYSQAVKRKRVYDDIGIQGVLLEDMKKMIETDNSVIIKEDEDLFNRYKNISQRISNLKSIFLGCTLSNYRYKENKLELEKLKFECEDAFNDSLKVFSK